MKITPLLLAAGFALTFSHPASAEKLIPSKADEAHSAAREETFIPWSTPEEGGRYWKELSSKNIPIYKEHQGTEGRNPKGRDLYIPNPGVGYWVLGGLNKESLWKTHHEKLKIKDELVSASVYQDSDGETRYWALWVPASKAHIIKAKMAEFGITPARVELTFDDHLRQLSERLSPYAPLAAFANLLLLIPLYLLFLRRSAKDDYGRGLSR